MKVVGKKKAAAKSKLEGLLAYHLHRHLAGTDPYWRVDALHASDVTKSDFCPRYFALAETLGHKPRPRRSGTCEQVVYSQGRLHATMLINWFAQIGLAWGNWRCAGCGAGRARTYRPDTCKECQSVVFRYVEARVKSAVSGISCGIDLFVALPGAKLLTVVELKSMQKDAFKSLKMPLIDHRERTSLYLRCVAESGDYAYVDTTEARVLYVCKDGYGEKTTVHTKEWGLRDMAWSPFKEYTIKRDDALTEEYVARAMPLKVWQSGGQMFPAGVCPHAMATRAEGCDLREQCFSGKYPAGETW